METNKDLQCKVEFEVGKTYVTHDWFSGATMKYTYEGREKDRPSVGVFSVEDFSIDGTCYRTEMYDVLNEDDGSEYVTINEYNGHLHCIYAKED